jgi:hypothetical protein
VSSSRRMRCMSRLDFRRSQHLSSLSPVSRWQRGHEGSRRNAIGKFRCGHGLCAGDGGRLGAELAGARKPNRTKCLGSWPTFVLAASIIFAPCLKTRIGPLRPGLLMVMRVIRGRRSDAEASLESALPDLWSWIPGSRPAAEPRNDWTTALPERAPSETKPR